MQDEIFRVLIEPELEKLLQFVSGRPHGVVRCEQNTVGAVGCDDFAHLFGGENIERCRGVNVEVFELGEIVYRRFPDGPAAEVSADKGYVGIIAQDGAETVGIGIVVALVARVQKYGELAGAELVDFEKIGVVYLEPLNFGMQLDSVQTEGQNLLDVGGDIGAVGVERAETGHTAAFGNGGGNKIVYGRYLTGGGGDGVHDEVAYTAAAAYLHQ